MPADQPDYSPTATKPTKTPQSPKAPRAGKSHHQVSKGSIFGIALISLLIAVALIYANSVIRQSQDIAPQAALSKSVELKLNASQNNLNPGQSTTVQVLIDDAQAQEVAAVDMTFETDGLEITDIQPGPFFNVTGNNHMPGKSSHEATVLKLEANRIAIGAACDYCYVGEKPNANDFPDIQECTNQDRCYPKVANGQVLATVTIKAIKQNGTATISFNESSTQVAVMDGNNEPPSQSALRTPTQTLSLSINGSGGLVACDADIANNDKLVETDDFNKVVNNFNPLQNCQGNACEADITNDGLVETDDFNFVVNNFNPLVSCDSQ